MSAEGMQNRPPPPIARRLLGVRPLVVLGILLGILVLSLGDIMEIIPLFAPLVSFSLFPFFHSIHDLLALGVALYAAYKYNSRLGATAILLFFATHIPYAIIQFYKEGPELLRILFIGFSALFGIWLINQLNKKGEEQKASQEILLQSEEKYRGLVDNVRLGIFRSTPGPTGRFLEVNRAMEEITGYSREELLRMNVSDLYLHPEEREAVIEETSSTPGKITKESNFRKKDGAEIVVADTKSPVKDDTGKILYFDGVLEDITERKKAEETLKLQSKLLDAELDSVYLHDFEGNIIYTNKAAYLTHGYTKEELLKMKFNNLDDPESAKLIAPRMKNLLEKGEATFNVNHLHKNGSLIPLEIHTALIEVGGKQLAFGVAHDITERLKAQEQLVAQDRLASIGQLVSGVAHELNNPLTSVIGFSELLLQRELPDDVKADLKIVNDEAKRTSLIVKNLLTFARQQPQDKRAIDINEPMQIVLQLRSYEQSINNIKVNTHFAPNLPQIMGNSSQLQQVFFNLVVNAEQAVLEAHNKGTLTISTKQIGNFVRASFTDDGPGISRENMTHLFIPFFTTKGIGKGTGLGLSICHGIITEHGGKIYAESETGKGATFIVELPLKQVATNQEVAR